MCWDMLVLGLTLGVLRSGMFGTKRIPHDLWGAVHVFFSLLFNITPYLLSMLTKTLWLQRIMCKWSTVEPESQVRKQTWESVWEQNFGLSVDPPSHIESTDPAIIPKHNLLSPGLEPPRPSLIPNIPTVRQRAGDSPWTSIIHLLHLPCVFICNRCKLVYVFLFAKSDAALQH